jgi:hypothetical protein
MHGRSRGALAGPQDAWAFKARCENQGKGTVTDALQDAKQQGTARMHIIG